MKIVVGSARGKTIKLLLPTRLIFNSITATIGARMIRKHARMDSSINAHDLRRFVKEVNRMKKIHPRMNIVDIESADGDIVQIRL
jgi:hypothetical protein